MVSMLSVPPPVLHPLEYCVLPRWIWAGRHFFLFRFTDDVRHPYSALSWTLGFSFFSDSQCYGLAQMPRQLEARFESMQWPDSPTHSVFLDLRPGAYQWVAHLWNRAAETPAIRCASSRDLPGLFVACGDLAVRKAHRRVDGLCVGESHAR